MNKVSPTPLIKKLGIKNGFRIIFFNAPLTIFSDLGSLPENITIDPKDKERINFILLFVKKDSELRDMFPTLVRKIVHNGMIWVAWPKKVSGISTDLSFNVVQNIGLSSGLVDTKICSINDVWSGLKFVFRIKDRPKITKQTWSKLK